MRGQRIIQFPQPHHVSGCYGERRVLVTIHARTESLLISIKNQEMCFNLDARTSWIREGFFYLFYFKLRNKYLSFIIYTEEFYLRIKYINCFASFEQLAQRENSQIICEEGKKKKKKTGARIESSSILLRASQHLEKQQQQHQLFDKWETREKVLGNNLVTILQQATSPPPPLLVRVFFFLFILQRLSFVRAQIQTIDNLLWAPCRPCTIQHIIASHRKTLLFLAQFIHKRKQYWRRQYIQQRSGQTNLSL